MQGKMLDTQPIVVVCSADENYAMPMTVTIYSALSNLRSKETKVVLFILDGGIHAATKRKIQNSLPSEQLQIKWITINPKEFRRLPEKCPRFSVERSD